MEENNNELVNALTLQMGTVFNPLLRDTTSIYQALNTQMERIANLFGAPPARNVQVPQIQNVRPIEIPVERPNVGTPAIQVQQPIVEQQIHEEVERIPVLVHRNQNTELVEKLDTHELDSVLISIRKKLT